MSLPQKEENEKEGKLLFFLFFPFVPFPRYIPGREGEESILGGPFSREERLVSGLNLSPSFLLLGWKMGELLFMSLRRKRSKEKRGWAEISAP